MLSALPEILTHEWLGSAAAEYLWAWDAATAERLLLDEAIDWVAHHHLIHTCPTSKIAIAAAVLIEKPSLFEFVDRCSWARSRLPTAGKNAQTLVEIIRCVPHG